MSDDAGHVVGVVNLEDIGYVDVRKPMTLSETVMHNPALIHEQTTLEDVAKLMMEKQQGTNIFIICSQLRAKADVVLGIQMWVKKIIELLST